MAEIEPRALWLLASWLECVTFLMFSWFYKLWCKKSTINSFNKSEFYWTSGIVVGKKDKNKIQSRLTYITTKVLITVEYNQHNHKCYLIRSELGCWKDFWEIFIVKKTIRIATFVWQVFITHLPPLLFVYAPTNTQGPEIFSVSVTFYILIALHFWEESETLQDEISILYKH